MKMDSARTVETAIAVSRLLALPSRPLMDLCPDRRGLNAWYDHSESSKDLTVHTYTAPSGDFDPRHPQLRLN